MAQEESQAATQAVEGKDRKTLDRKLGATNMDDEKRTFHGP